MNPPQQQHLTSRGGWLRAAVLGANDGVVSIASMIVGVASASVTPRAVVVSGIAGLAAGAMSMAVGEYVSVSSQRDVEEADVELERRHLQENPEYELEELTNIYVERGLDRDLARKVAEQLSARDLLRTHLRDELGFSDAHRARPLQAALVSAASFASLAICPIVGFVLAPTRVRVETVAAVSLAALAALGALGAGLGGAPRLRGAVRVLVGGGLAMAASAAIGRFLGLVGL
ncbi:MAG TPA: VIT family protein [Polyangia bacterium]|nr:VIT family protein [Polyangia bacterium]